MISASNILYIFINKRNSSDLFFFLFADVHIVLLLIDIFVQRIMKNGFFYNFQINAEPIF
jgi:hypothetical protein